MLTSVLYCEAAQAAWEPSKQASNKGVLPSVKTLSHLFACCNAASGRPPHQQTDHMLADYRCTQQYECFPTWWFKVQCLSAHLQALEGLEVQVSVPEVGQRVVDDVQLEVEAEHARHERLNGAHHAATPAAQRDTPMG